jgi:hypothetical protein
MVNVGVFYDHLEYFKAIWYNLWPFGIVCGHLFYISQFGMFGPRKIWQLWPGVDFKKPPYKKTFRPKFTDKPSFGQIYVCYCDLKCL